MIWPRGLRPVKDRVEDREGSVSVLARTQRDAGACAAVTTPTIDANQQSNWVPEDGWMTRALCAAKHGVVSAGRLNTPSSTTRALADRISAKIVNLASKLPVVCVCGVCVSAPKPD